MKAKEPKTKPVAIAERLLDSRAVQAISANRSFIVMFVWLVLRAFQLFFLTPNQDVQRYFQTSGQWLADLIPYQQFTLEYPPGALILFTLPRFLARGQAMADFITYGKVFAAEMLLLDVAILFFLSRLPDRLHALSSSAKGPSSPVRRYDTTLVMLAYIVFSSFTGALAFERYDLCTAVIFLAWLDQALAPEQTEVNRYMADFLIALGVWTKLITVLVVPVYLVYIFLFRRQEGAEPVKNPIGAFINWFFREGLIRVGIMAAFTAGLFLPFLAQSKGALWSFLEYHEKRGMQLETLYSGILMIFKTWFNMPLVAAYIQSAGCTEVKDQPGISYSDSILGYLSSVNTWVAASPVITVLAAAGVTLWFAWRLLQATSQKDRNFLLLNATLALLCAMILFNKVYSPQYMLWIAPIVPLVMLNKPERTRSWVLGFGVAFAVTALILLFYYRNLIMMDPFAVVLLNIRNFMMLGLFFSVLEIPIPATPSTEQFWQRARAFSTHRAWGWVALAICVMWTFFANLSETTANDIWIQLRSGQDLVNTGIFPYTETYSTTVMNRPFIAHEWLSGLIFYGLTSAFGGAGLSFLAAFVALAAFVLLYFCFEKEQRNTWYYLPLLLLVTYLISFRILVRPHIFTIVAQSALLLAFERWRRDGKTRELLWLLPIQVIWVNLHAAALFGPALLGLLTGVVALMVVFPGLQRGSEVRTFGVSDVVQLGGITGAMIVACLINPYHYHLLQFSLDLLGNDYAKNRVWEWTTPFLAANTSYYWLWLYVSALFLTWVSLFVRLRTLPVVDFVLAAVVTYFSVRANRFVPDLAIFGFPVIARSLWYLTEMAFEPRLRVQIPWLEMGVGGLLLCNAVTYGYAHSAREHRPMIGWGYGGDMPYMEVDIIKKMGLKGVIYNEYSDGALIIHDLVPTVRPVLDSRIDLYPSETVTEYDSAYLNPELFKAYVKKWRVNIVMLYRNRAHPAVLQYLKTDPTWQLLSDANGRVLYYRRGMAESGTARAPRDMPLPM